MKRFTETEKWRDTWFRKLSAPSKLAYLYILDNCDAAGVWDPDYDLADFTIGVKADWVAVLREMGERVKTLENGKWYLVRFVGFQYGELVIECRPHAKVMQLLKGHGIPYQIGYVIPTRQDKDKDKDKDKDNTPEHEALVISPESIYAEYPRKEGKGDALKAIAKAMKAGPPIRLLTQTKAFADATKRWNDHDRKFIPHPATWFNRGSYDDDPQSWVRSYTNPHQAPKPDYSKGFDGEEERASA
jgi:hypothetical protein